MLRKFRGSEEVKVDGKGRMSIPARFRRIFEQGDPDWSDPGGRTRLVVVYGPEDWKKLEFYTVMGAERIDAEIDALPRATPERLWLETLMNGCATEAEIDAEGRLVLPQKLRDKIGLDGAAYLTSKGDYIEVWSPENHHLADAALQEFVASHPEGFDPRAYLQKPRVPADGS